MSSARLVGNSVCSCGTSIPATINPLKSTMRRRGMGLRLWIISNLIVLVSPACCSRLLIALNTICSGVKLQERKKEGSGGLGISGTQIIFGPAGPRPGPFFKNPTLLFSQLLSFSFYLEQLSNCSANCCSTCNFGNACTAVFSTNKKQKLQ